MKQKAKVQLVKFVCDEDGSNKVLNYSIEHNNGETSLEQKLILTEINQGLNTTWHATIELEEFPFKGKPKDAAFKLAEWLERLAAGIRVGNFEEIQTAKFQEVKNEY